ncbi:MAG TPA: PilZ domain-containing protein [Dehalococcoidia bacterium]
MAGWNIAHDAHGARRVPSPGASVLLQTISRGALHQWAGTLVGLNEDALVLMVPPEALGALWRGAGQGVVVTLHEGGHEYVFDSVVLEIAEAPRPTVRLRVPDRIFPIERREYYRLTKLIRPRAAELLAGEEGARQPLRAVISNISGGGLQFLAPQPVSTGSLVRMEVPLSTLDDTLEVKVQVLAVRAPEEGRSLYRISGRFRDLPERDRRRLMQFIFREQIELRRRGLA